MALRPSSTPPTREPAQDQDLPRSARGALAAGEIGAYRALSHRAEAIEDRNARHQAFAQAPRAREPENDEARLLIGAQG